MKRKILIILLLLLCPFLLTSCGNEEKNNSENEVKAEEEEKIVTEEITEGEIEGYKFKETDEITNRVKIQMQSGDIILIVLSNSDTPITIANFQKLVSEHFYDGLTFHRIMKGFMIQTGDPNGNGTGGSDEEIKGEFKLNGVENNLSHTRGVVSMARRGGNPDTEETMNSASSQFFIVHEDSTFLDGNYASFGKVFAGMDTVDKIANTEVGPDEQTPLKKPVIKSIRFIEIEKVS